MSASHVEPAPVLAAAPPTELCGGDPLDPGSQLLGKDSLGKGILGKDSSGKGRKGARMEAKTGAKGGAKTGAGPAAAELPARPSDGKAPAARPPAARSVGWALVQAARLHRARVGDRLAALDLFAGQEQVVQALAVAGSMTMGDLAATLRVRPPTASKTISRLAALGFVERRAEAGDGRIVRVRLTETGLAKAAAIQRIWDEVEAELLAGFEGKERRRLRKLLRKAAGNLAEAAGVTGHEAEPETEADDEAEVQLAATARLPGQGA